MSLRYVCDGGCGETTDDPASFKKFGIAREAHYCETCAPAVEKYYADRDVLHDKLAAAWWKDLGKLESAWKKAYSEGRLPDEAP